MDNKDKSPESSVVRLLPTDRGPRTRDYSEGSPDAQRAAYYARPACLAGTAVETADLTVLSRLGFARIETDTPELHSAAQKVGPEAYQPLVEGADAVFFRAFPDGRIDAAVTREIEWAKSAGVPVLEMPSGLARRALTREQTSETLRELGYL